MTNEQRVDTNILRDNITKLHTTNMGIDRIKKNLQLSSVDVVEYCRKKFVMQLAEFINRERTGIVRTETSLLLLIHTVTP